MSREFDAQPARRPRDFLDGLLLLGGLALHLAIGVFPFSASGLLAPLWGVVVVGLIWLAGLVAAIVLARTRPRLVPLVPLAALAISVGLIFAGDRLLGWIA